MISIADRLKGVGEYYFSAKLREIDALNKAGKQIINLGIGSPDMPPHPAVIDALQQNAAMPNVHGYQSYKGSSILRKAIADWYQKWYNVSLDAETEILPLIGSKEGIMHICMTYLNKNDEALVPNPGYPTYSSAVSLSGGISRNYEMNASTNWSPDFLALEQQDLSRVKLMFVNYPHMPTGQNGQLNLFEKIIAFARKHNILVVHDNPYSFILNDQPLSMLQANAAKDVVIELNSLSKSHNMAGWRVGMLCGNKERIDEVLRFKSNMDSGMFLPLQLAAAKALSLGKDWFEELNKVYARRREKVFELLDLLQCNYQKNQVGLFVWAQVPNNVKDGFVLSDDILYQYGVFITPGGIFGTAGNMYVRISLCATVEKLTEAIQRIK
ncbi:MAG: aminotransferase class I/II-fold pyridoxal phosphate-dependent enzyme [Bacteroidota bacterium]|nr:aminotransferase class I/II-fold pyridoxal phosphate-dependent enzyme [Bacteroidota bacterium]